mmetsp:Transcript_82225/g.228170  ORF Transcript_82225/g.228170 Transcript_82225/m.228170 type:complete len:385 (+) Transcript_82225:86-1240(+)
MIAAQYVRQPASPAATPALPLQMQALGTTSSMQSSAAGPAAAQAKVSRSSTGIFMSGASSVNPRPTSRSSSAIPAGGNLAGYPTWAVPAVARMHSRPAATPQQQRPSRAAQLQVSTPRVPRQAAHGAGLERQSQVVQRTSKALPPHRISSAGKVVASDGNGLGSPTAGLQQAPTRRPSDASTSALLAEDSQGHAGHCAVKVLPPQRVSNAVAGTAISVGNNGWGSPISAQGSRHSALRRDSHASTASRPAETPKSPAAGLRSSSEPSAPGRETTSPRRTIKFGHRESIEVTGLVKSPRPVRSSIEEEMIQQTSIPSARSLAGPKRMAHIEAIRRTSFNCRHWQSFTVDDPLGLRVMPPPSWAMSAPFSPAMMAAPAPSVSLVSW